MAYSPSGHNNKVYLPKLLKTYTHVFIQDTARLYSLQPRYHRLFKVIKQNKFLTVIIKNEEQNISLDRLKPAILEDSYLAVALSNIVAMDITKGNKQSLNKETH